MKKLTAFLTSLFLLYSFVVADFVQALNITVSDFAVNEISVKIRPSLGSVSDEFLNPQNNNTVVYIRDLHVNYSVQKNIAKIIQELDKNYGVDKILVEGAPYSKLDLAAVDTVKQYKLSNIMLESGLLSGTEYFLANYNKNNDVGVYGLEDWNIYSSNLKRASYLLKEKERNLEAFNAFEKKIISKIDNSYNLLKYIYFDVTDYKIFEETKQPVLKYESLYNYMQLSQQIKYSDTDKIAKELNKCLKDLKTALPYAEYKYIVAKMQSGDYYESYSLVKKYISSDSKLSSKYDLLLNFLNYYTAQKNISKTAAVEQKNKYFADYMESLKKESAKYDKIFVLKMTDLFKSFIKLNMSEQEYQFFTGNYDRYIDLINKIIPDAQSKYDEIFDNQEIFSYYDINSARTKIFFENISDVLGKNKETSKKITVVVAGGYHGSFEEYFKKAGISFVAITPEITDYDASDNTYEKILLSSLDGKFSDQALSNILFILINNPVIPQQTKYFFSKQLILNAIKTYGTDTPENISGILFDIAKKHGIEIEISFNESEFSVVINKSKNVFKIENGRIDLKESKYPGRTNISLFSRIIAAAKRFFGIEQSLFMELKPEYRSILSSRSDGNASFVWSQINMLLKRKDAAYKHIIDFGNSLVGSDGAVKYENVLIKKFDSKGNVVLKDDGTPEILKKITVVVEYGLNNYISMEFLQKLFDEIISESEPDDISNVKDTMVIGLLEKSQTLFSDHVNNGFIGINSALFKIYDDKILETFLRAGLIHEFSHEFAPKKALEEELLLNDVKYIKQRIAEMLEPGISGEHYAEELNDRIVEKIIESTSNIFPINSRFFNKIRNYKHSIEDIAYIFNRNDKEYLTDKESGKYGQWQHAYQEYLKNKADNQEKFFSLLVHDDNSKKINMTEYLYEKDSKAHVQVNNINSRIQNMLFATGEESRTNDSMDSVESLRQILTSAGINEDIQEDILDEFKENIYECLELLYKKMPRYAFYRFYTDKTAVHEHGLSHCLDVLAYSIKIIGRSGDVNKLLPNAPENERIDVKELVYSVFMHDLSCIFFRDNHEKNSAVWAKGLLQDSENEQKINAIYNDCLGHKKIEMERSLIGCILHDADALSATLNFKRILNIWMDQDRFFFDGKISINERLSKLKEGLYLYEDGCDSINDLLRHYLRSDPAKYKTSGGASIIKARYEDIYVVKNFLEEQREYIKTKVDRNGRQYNDADVDLAIKTVNDIMSLKVEEYDKQQTMPVVMQQESLFNFKTKLNTLWQLVRYKIKKETMYFNRNIVFSDIHGGYTRFLELMYQMVSSSRDSKILNYFELLHNGKDLNGYEIPEAEIRRMQEEIEVEILNKWNVKGNRSTIYILGDILDRGPKQIETFMFIKRLSETGRVKYVLGNHDLFASMNLFGMHLPISEKFKGIPQDYDIPAGYLGKNKANIYSQWYERVTNARDLSRSKDIAYWLEVFSERSDYSKQRQKTLWNNELEKMSYEFRAAFGFNQDLSVKYILSNTQSNIFGLKENSELLEFNKSFFGIKFDTEISTGLRDVEQMAVNWWTDKYSEAVSLKEKYPEYEAYWNNVIALIEKVIYEQKIKYNDEIQQGNWGWGVVDAMMYRAYESMEWYAYDYIKHKGWGEALLSQINSHMTFKKGEELNKKLNDKFFKFTIDGKKDKNEAMSVIYQMEQIGVPQSYIGYLKNKLDALSKISELDEANKIIDLIDVKISRYNRLKDADKASFKAEMCDLIVKLDALGLMQSEVENLLKKVLELPDQERENRQKRIDENIKTLTAKMSAYADSDDRIKMISEMEIKAIIEDLGKMEVSDSLIKYLEHKIDLVINQSAETVTDLNNQIKSYAGLAESDKDNAKTQMWKILLELEKSRIPYAIIEELSVRIKALPLTEREKYYKPSERLIDDVSYFNNEAMRSILTFFKNNFALYRVDEYGFYYMHAPLPYDEYGDVSIGRVNEEGKFEEFDSKGKRIKGFYYKGVHYTGKKIWKGFSEISKDIREYDIEKDDQSKIFEALAIINAVYADNTTRIKPEYIAKYHINFTMEQMNKAIGIGTVIQGHNPKDKLARNGLTTFALDQQGRPVSIFVDGNMSPAYAKTRGAGSYVEISPQGIYSIGFPSGLATVTVGLEAKINENNVIKTIISNITRSSVVIDSIVKITLRATELVKRAREILNTKQISLSNATVLKPIKRITDDKDIIERLNYNGINCVGIVTKKDFDGNILDLIEPVVRKKSVKEEQIETTVINGSEVKINFVTVKIAKNTLKLISADYNSSQVAYDDVVQYILLNAAGNELYAKYTGKRKNVLLACSFQENKSDYMAYEQVKPFNCSPQFNTILSDAFKLIPIVYNLKKEAVNGDFSDGFDKNLSFDIIQTILSAA